MTEIFRFSALSPVAAASISCFRETSLSVSKFSYLRPPQPSRLLRFTVKASGDFSSDNSFGFFPWDSPLPEGDGNFGLWQRRVKDLLMLQGMVKALYGVQPEGINYTNWKEMEAKVVTTIRLCLADDVLYHVMEEDSLAAVWKKLKTIQWVPEERITLFTADGLIQLGGSMVPRRVSASDGKLKTSQKLQRFQESNYMDPKQGLCLGALFDIAATNGLDMGRRLCIFGFCRSIEMLSDVVEDTVLEHGGEVVAAEKASKEGLQEKLTMTVAVPLLWGVPPASETLHLAVRSGGGIVEKVYWQWDFL
ncbi:uncharacterized protein LOC131168552 isoform X2 [Malania oleifera]|uniref:uncharacterized protein LOC131168552 isoform X2 n=1 Tax=Malania oleifera TaxID=397392 RepID=UPI0025ADB196|nr:uncharacterized protein LOC131168552 isoform X2 [Malania oleifera]